MSRRWPAGVGAVEFLINVAGGPVAPTREQAAAKGGIIGLSKTLALELGPHNVTVNAVAPGFIRTPRIAEANWGNATEALLPLRRAGEPDDIAGVVAILCSDAGGYVSGATIDVNGGWYFGP